MKRFVAVALVALAAAGAPARAALPCAAAPGVNDRCETWAGLAGDVVKGVATSGGYAFAVGSVTGRLAVTAYDAKTGTVRWIGRASTPLPTAGLVVTTSPDGRSVYAAGTLTLRPNINSNPFDYFLTTRFDAKSGRLLWATVYKGIGANYNAPTAIAVSPRGDRVYVTGWSDRPGPFQKLPRDWATVGYDARTGRQAWVTRYAGLAGGTNVPVGIAVSPRGDRVYVTGRSEHPTQSPTPIYDIATIAYSATGTARWIKRTPGTPAGLVLRGDHVWVAGATATGSGTIAAYAGPSGGAVASVAMSTAPYAFTVSPDESRLYLASASAAAQQVAGYTTLGITVAALDVKTRRQAWTVTYAPPGSGFALPTALAVNAAGSKVYATGVVGPTFAEVYPVTLCVTSAGAQSWAARYDLREPTGPTSGLDGRLAVARDGRVFVSGAVAPPPLTGSTHGVVLAYAG